MAQEKVIDIVRAMHDVKLQRKDILAGYRVDVYKIEERGGKERDHGESSDRYWIIPDTYLNTPAHANANLNLLRRNSRVAIALQRTPAGNNYTLSTIGKGENVGSTFHYNGHILNNIRLDENGGQVNIEGEKAPYLFDTLDNYLKVLQKNEEAIRIAEEEKRKLEEKRKQDLEEQERKELEKEIQKIERAQRKRQEYKAEVQKITNYIRRSVQLRFRPIIDTIQTTIKVSHLYDKVALIIDGGPGTGKTTTMIARLKYLTDTYALQEEDNPFSLSRALRQDLLERIKTDRDWIFFSPTDLLKQYLQSAMVGETLQRPNDKVFCFADFLKRSMQNYGFINPSSDKPTFSFQHPTATSLITDGEMAIYAWEYYIVDTFKKIYNNLPAIKNSNDDWIPLAQRIAQRMEHVDTMSLDELIELFRSLRSSFYEECTQYTVELKNLRDNLFTRILAKINLNKEVKEKLVVWINSEQNVDEQDTEEDSDNEGADEEREENEVDIDSLLERFVRNWIKAYANALHKEHALNKTNETLTNLLSPILKDMDLQVFERIDSLYTFDKFAKYTYGAEQILFKNISGKYKKFRAQLLKAPDSGYDKEQLKSIIGTENRKIHQQEAALLIGFVNKLSVRILQKQPNASHKYIDCYQHFCRPIIGIDEATDFSQIELYAICSFAHKDYYAITLSGDLMQRLTQGGLKSWKELEGIVPQYEVMPLTTSYRQSSRMLEVARQLYIDSIGNEPTYKAYMREKKVPAPITLITSDLSEKIHWIERRIKEVYKAYGDSLPSIAIFLNDKKQVATFAQDLFDQTDFFNDNGIDVVDGSNGATLGTANQVRVFPIDKVKGMEFDVVFFIDIDATPWDELTIKRYLYVGVSRAAFFLGATFTQDRPELTKYFEVGGDWKQI